MCCYIYLFKNGLVKKYIFLFIFYFIFFSMSPPPVLSVLLLSNSLNIMRSTLLSSRWRECAILVGLPTAINTRRRRRRNFSVRTEKTLEAKNPQKGSYLTVCSVISLYLISCNVVIWYSVYLSDRNTAVVFWQEQTLTLMKWIEIENESKYNGLHYDFRSEEFSNIDRNM